MYQVSTTNNAGDKPKWYCHLKSLLWLISENSISGGSHCNAFIFCLPSDNHDVQLVLSVILVNSEICLLCKRGSNSDGCTCISMLIAVFFVLFRHINFDGPYFFSIVLSVIEPYGHLQILQCQNLWEFDSR